MNETPLASTPAPESNDVAQALTSLQLQFQATLIILIMLSGALNLYLFRQYRMMSKEVAVLEPQVVQLADGYQRVTVPLVNKFLSRLTDYTKTHPDFQAILDKYRIQAAPTSAVPATAVPASTPTPAPAKTTAPAKSPTPAAATKK